MRKETNKDGKKIVIELSITNPIKQARQSFKRWISSYKQHDHHKINFLVGSIEWGRSDGKRKEKSK